MLNWVKSAYLASAVHCGALPEHTLIAKILAAPSPETLSFALHTCFNDAVSAKKWGEGVGASLRQKLTERWGEKALAFHTYLEPFSI